jgi:hypothetical protein
MSAFDHGTHGINPWVCAASLGITSAEVMSHLRTTALRAVRFVTLAFAVPVAFLAGSRATFAADEVHDRSKSTMQKSPLSGSGHINST